MEKTLQELYLKNVDSNGRIYYILEEQLKNCTNLKLITISSQ